MDNQYANYETPYIFDKSIYDLKAAPYLRLAKKLSKEVKEAHIDTLTNEIAKEDIRPNFNQKLYAGIQSNNDLRNSKNKFSSGLLFWMEYGGICIFLFVIYIYIFIADKINLSLIITLGVAILLLGTAHYFDGTNKKIVENNRITLIYELYLFGGLTDKYFQTRNEFNLKPYSEFEDKKEIENHLSANELLDRLDEMQEKHGIDISIPEQTA